MLLHSVTKMLLLQLKLLMTSLKKHEALEIKAGVIEGNCSIS